MLPPLICGRVDGLMASPEGGGSLDEMFWELEEYRTFIYSWEVAPARRHLDEAAITNIPIFPRVRFALVH